MGRFPARLHVVMASKASVGVVFRRGPAGAVCTVGWNRAKDTFRVGQWLRGRIYERRADISPDGKHLIYFARGGRRHVETKGSWTAISRAPFLKAVTLWGKADCWQGGGLFLADKKYWLNGRACTVFVKKLPQGWVLRKLAYADVNHPMGSGAYWNEHELEHAGRKALLDCKAWEWADRDGDSLVWAEKGVLYRAEVGRLGPGGARALMDFNSMEFEAIEAPY